MPLTSGQEAEIKDLSDQVTHLRSEKTKLAADLFIARQEVGSLRSQLEMKDKYIDSLLHRERDIESKYDDLTERVRFL